MNTRTESLSISQFADLLGIDLRVCGATVDRQASSVTLTFEVDEVWATAHGAQGEPATRAFVAAMKHAAVQN